VLVLVEKRETRYRVQWYYSLYEATLRSLNREPRSGVLPSAGARAACCAWRGARRGTGS
jgi:hypothetical protein